MRTWGINSPGSVVVDWTYGRSSHCDGGLQSSLKGKERVEGFPTACWEPRWMSGPSQQTPCPANDEIRHCHGYAEQKAAWCGYVKSAIWRGLHLALIDVRDGCGASFVHVASTTNTLIPMHAITRHTKGTVANKKTCQLSINLAPYHTCKIIMFHPFLRPVCLIIFILKKWLNYKDIFVKV